MNKIKKFYGICIKDCGVINRNSNREVQLLKGDLIRILETDNAQSDKVIIKLFNCNENTFKTEVLECLVQNIEYIVDALWLFLIGVKENHIRTRIYNERDLVLGLKCDSEITIKSYENDTNANIKGVIKLIGNVKEVGYGNFIGIEIQRKPVNHQTLVRLYNTHFNDSVSLLLFRIEELLDDLTRAVEQKTFQTRNFNVKPELPLFVTPDRNQTPGDRLSSAQQDTNVFNLDSSNNRMASSYYSSNRTNNESPHFDVNPAGVSNVRRDNIPYTNINSKPNNNNYVATSFNEIPHELNTVKRDMDSFNTALTSTSNYGFNSGSNYTPPSNDIPSVILTKVNNMGRDNTPYRPINNNYAPPSYEITHQLNTDKRDTNPFNTTITNTGNYGLNNRSNYAPPSNEIPPENSDKKYNIPYNNNNNTNYRPNNNSSPPSYNEISHELNTVKRDFNNYEYDNRSNYTPHNFNTELNSVHHSPNAFNSSKYAPPSYDVNSIRQDPIQMDKSSINSQGRSNTIWPTVPDTDNFNTATQPTFHGSNYNSNNPQRAKDWSKQNNQWEPNSSSIKDLRQNSSFTSINNTAPSFQDEQLDAQLVDLNINTKSAVPKNHEPKANHKKNGRNKGYKKKKNNIPKDIAFTKNAPQTKQFNNRNDSLKCLMCLRPFNIEMLILGCNHCICIQCFGFKSSSLIRTNQVKCPFRRGVNFSCSYQLAHHELNQLRQKIEKFSQPTVSRSPSITSDDSVSDEELFECKTIECDGQWYISKSDSVNLFRCPVCEFYNCVHCKVIHDGMTCKEYMKLQKASNQNIFRNMVDKVVSYIPAVVTERKRIPDGADGPDGNEILMKCKGKNCEGQWFLLKSDRNALFKCPVCDLYNCNTCNAIHLNQTCEEYQESKRLIPNFMRFKNVPIKPAPGNPNPEHDNEDNENKQINAEPVENIIKKKIWKCSQCTFENYSFGVICNMCGQKSEN